MTDQVNLALEHTSEVASLRHPGCTRWSWPPTPPTPTPWTCSASSPFVIPGLWDLACARGGRKAGGPNRQESPYPLLKGGARDSDSLRSTDDDGPHCPSPEQGRGTQDDNILFSL
jgi:hypothetical protein